MSFFGFDPLGQQKQQEQQKQHQHHPHTPSAHRNSNANELDFDETHRGYGHRQSQGHGIILQDDEYDALNNETFGDFATEDLNTEFDFGYGAASATSTGQNPHSGTNGPTASSFNQQSEQIPPPVSYAAIAHQPLNTAPGHPSHSEAMVDMQPMQSLWGSAEQANVAPHASQSDSQPRQLGFQEIEKQMAMQQQQQQQQPGFFGGAPQFPFGMGFPPQMQQNAGFPPMNAPNQGNHPFPMQMNGHQFPPIPPQHMNGQQFPPQANGQFPMMPMQMGGHFPNMPPNMSQPPQSQQNQQNQQESQQQTRDIQNNHGVSHHEQLPQHHHQQQQQQQQQRGMPEQQNMMHDGPLSPPHTPKVQGGHEMMNNNAQHHGGNNYGGYLRRYQVLNPEELRIRQAKVEKIMKHSGLMTPRDKDFITRFQLSKIVNENPLTSDFYYQFFKIMKSDGFQVDNKDAIARAYLDISGHRLGGKNKSVQVALQRMQNQVAAAVTVAKERNTILIDPRKRINVSGEEVTGEESLSGDVNPNGEHGHGSRRSSTISPHEILSKNNSKNNKKLALALIEEVYDEVLLLEDHLRNKESIDSSYLCEIVGENVVFFLSFSKGIKIVPRVFNFFSKTQKFEILTKILSKLSSLDMIASSSYNNQGIKKFTEEQILDFKNIFLKIVCGFLSTAEFQEVLMMITCILNNNNVSYICTSKIGLNLVTVLINRAALFKQDRTSSNMELWNEIYDRLFTSLETKLSLIFPPESFVSNDTESNNNNNSNNHSANEGETYIWQFFASLALSGKLNHQRIIIDEIRDNIFGTIAKAESLKSFKIYQDLNLFLNVMGLVARDGEIGEL